MMAETFALVYSNRFNCMYLYNLSNRSLQVLYLDGDISTYSSYWHFQQACHLHTKKSLLKIFKEDVLEIWRE
jgi:hypothetical protein